MLSREGRMVRGSLGSVLQCIFGRLSIILLVSFGLILSLDHAARADITGTSRIDFFMEPISCTVVGEIKLDTPCEKTILTFDIESVLAVNVSVSGLSMTLNSAMGIAGLEHLIVVGNATIGSVDVIPELWLAAPFQSVIDINNNLNIVLILPGNLMFVKKRFTTVFNLAGVSIRNLAIFEDVTFPNPGAVYGVVDCDGDGLPEGTCVHGIQTNPFDRYQTQTFAFGDLLQVSAATPSGVSLLVDLGICATRDANVVKKFAAEGKVNPECASQPKPDILFDFLSTSISGIPIAPGVFASTAINCIKVTKCQLLSTLSVSGTGFPAISLSLLISELFNLSFSGITLQLDLGVLNAILSINDKFEFTGANFSFSSFFDRGGLIIRTLGNVNFVKPQGLVSAQLTVAAVLGTFNANHTLSLIRDPVAGGLKFGSFNVSMSKDVNPIRLTIALTYGKAGLTRAGFRVILII